MSEQMFDHVASEVDESRVVVDVEHLVARLRRVPVDRAIVLAQQCQARFAAVETELLARTLDAGASDAATETAAGRGGVRSKADARRAARRADAVRSNPELGADLDSGRLSLGQLDAIAAGSARTDGDAARDDDLLERVRRTANPDQARQVVEDWETRRAIRDDIDRAHAHNRRNRNLRRFRTRDGAAAIMARGDRIAIDEMWTCIEALANAFYHHDGGRSIPASHHPRNRDQRLFDAALTLLTGTHPHSPDPQPSPSEPASPTGPWRPVLHITASVRDLFADGTDPATLVGSGPLPTADLDRYGCYADLIGTLFGGNGELLWQGRRVRTVTDAQWDALVARDRGCVLCGAVADHDEAHHLVPWTAPAKGRTDIDELALVCAPCHRHLHAINHTLERDRHTHTWRTRPATPDETPRRRKPPHPGNDP